VSGDHPLIMAGPIGFARLGVMQALNKDTTPQVGAGSSMTDDGYRCELCGAWVEYRNLSKVLAHEGPLPHVEQDRPAVGNGTDSERKKPPPD
jgi:hypothetical protein